ncbi:non-ribosomal peptide synthetase [Phytohabitans kaempferiae]|uniref:Non-ribosomal peptide synthetase n=1 Tax=Phytohabitans kaempferiae TaxID=1620943 RepID=A0ABV6LYS6_9ACTN
MEPEFLPDTLLVRADRSPDVVAYECVDPQGPVTTLTYAQVASRASALAARLATAEDGPVLLACPAGLDYVVAVFGGFLAGRPVIPAFPPGPSSRPDRDRLAGIVGDARPPVVVAPERYPEITTPTALTVPGAEADGTTPARPRRVTGDDVAVIQYTSGSTGQPRGVLVRHGSLAANTVSIAEKFRLGPESRALTWLPPFHDMGLVGGLLTPMTAGIPMRVMQPGHFLKSPLSWLRQISETGATHTGGPNFGYDLCLHRARGDEDLAGLDLSRWQVAFSGGETVRHRTLAAFARRFAPAGFRAEAFLPCYGLAEATLIVSAGHWSGPSADGDAVVSCGTPVRGQRVAIVDPEQLSTVDEGAEGEIWIAGPNVTPGYLSGDTGDLFGELDGTRYLRTGDLGHLRGGELYVSGRVKDVIVYRGVNHHAVDVEAAALDAVGRVGRTAAAFLVESGAEPLPVLVLEAHGTRDEALATEVRSAVLSRTGLRLGLVALVPPRSLPRTTSGKIRRSATRDAFLAGAFDGAVLSDRAPLAALAEGRAQAATATELATLVCGILAAICEVGDCRPTDDLADLGVDSVRAAEAAAVLEHALGLTVPLETILAVSTPEEAADALLREWRDQGHEPAYVRDRMVMAQSGAGVV